MTTKADGLYTLYAQKDQAGYIRLQKEFFNKMGELADPSDYQCAIMALMDVVGNKLSKESATEALVWLDKLLSSDLNISSRIRYLSIAGDCYVALDNSEKARSCYNQAYTLSFQTRDINFQIGLQEKLNLLE